jgi:hypothetical protein
MNVTVDETRQKQSGGTEPRHYRQRGNSRSHLRLKSVGVSCNELLRESIDNRSKPYSFGRCFNVFTEDAIKWYSHQVAEMPDYYRIEGLAPVHDAAGSGYISADDRYKLQLRLQFEIYQVAVELRKRLQRSSIAEIIRESIINYIDHLETKYPEVIKIKNEVCS